MLSPEKTPKAREKCACPAILSHSAVSLQVRAAKRKRGASKGMLAASKQSTLSPEQRQITAFFGGPAGFGRKAVQTDAGPIDLDPDPKVEGANGISKGHEGLAGGYVALQDMRDKQKRT